MRGDLRVPSSRSLRRDDADAVRLANESAFGVGGSVWTNDLERGIGVARRVQTGTVGINGYIPEPTALFGINGHMPEPTAPFGGYKGSGIGREIGPEALAGYMQYQTVHLPAMV